MKIYFRREILALISILFILNSTSCDEEITTLGSGVIGNSPFVTDRAIFDVFAYNKNVETVEANKLALYQIGVYNDPLYGKTTASINSQIGLQNGAGNPIFGLYSQRVEDDSANDGNPNTINENETIKEVTLYIPYLQNPNGDLDLDGVPDDLDADPNDPNSDSDGDGLTDSEERVLGTDPLNGDTDNDGIPDNADNETLINSFPRRVDLDSIYGNRDVPFNFKVDRSTFFLRDLDPGAGFLESQEYYSSQEFAPEFVSDLLFEGEVLISDEEILIPAEDDPDTEADESLGDPQRIQPGIRVVLDPDFFQENILDKEGGTELLSQANFREFIRGLYLSINAITSDMLILLDISDGQININYEFDRLENGQVVKNEADYQLSFITATSAFSTFNGNAVNTLVNDAYPSEVLDQLDTDENANRIFLKGGAGTFAEIHLFENNNGETIINQIKENNWIINEANLIFYVDRATLDNAGIVDEPPYLYLYNAETSASIYDLSVVSATDIPTRINLNYGGFLEKNNNKGTLYKIKITDYINDIIIRDSTNATLGLNLSPDLTFVQTKNAVLEQKEQNLPVSNTVTPLSTVLFGSNVSGVEEDKKLQLEIFYTEPN
ncbi:DUF4270 family protein [Eudoraea sp.]|uniref:DUF4270 domain-containing protein n=1 Tax=Eudoraea sp. TaxID=1979955 RepID=UPI003C76E90E